MTKIEHLNITVLCIDEAIVFFQMVVDNIAIIENALLKVGYKRSIDTPQEKFRKRLYFFDHAGFEWELVEYSSDIVSEKYLYE